MMTEDDPLIRALREQLAAAKAEIDRLRLEIHEMKHRPWACWCGARFPGFDRLNQHLAEQGHLRL